MRSGLVKKRIEEYNRTAAPEDKIEITGNQAKPVGLYGYYMRHSETIYFSGFGSRDKNGAAINGRIGDIKTLEQGQVAAKGACLNFLNNLFTACSGHMDEIKGVSIRVDINCTPDFKQLPKVADGASKLLNAVFGNYIGMPIRTAAGNSSLPNDMSVEISAMALITKKLAAELDLRDAKELVEIVRLAGLLFEKSDDSKLREVLEADALTPEHKKHLEQRVNDLLIKLVAMDDKKIHKPWNFHKNKALLNGAESAKDLMELLVWKALHLELKVNPLEGKPLYLVKECEPSRPEALAMPLQAKL